MNAVTVRHHVRRAATLVGGVLLIAAGLVLLVLPGPGVPLLIAGLALLAREFHFARVLLDRGRDHVDRVIARVRRRDRR